MVGGGGGGSEDGTLPPVIPWVRLSRPRPDESKVRSVVTWSTSLDRYLVPCRPLHPRGLVLKVGLILVLLLYRLT